MNARLLLVALILACAAQWAVPAWLIQRGQATLAQGSAYRFRTAPVDPLDPFRGRYVALDFEAARVNPLGVAQRYAAGERLYAPILVGADGYARLAAPLRRPPDSGDYLEVRVQWAGDGELGLRLPFDRYYLDERLAPQAERAYAQANRARPGADAPTAGVPTYALVRVRQGYALIEELYLEGRPLRALLHEAAR